MMLWLAVGGREKGSLLGEHELEWRIVGRKGGDLFLPVFPVNFSVIHSLTSSLDEKVRRIDQPRRLSKSPSPESRENQRDRIMSGRPRTTSFAESCKPVPQPSAFGSMKVSSKYSPVPLEQPTFFPLHAPGPVWAKCLPKMCQASMTLAPDSLSPVIYLCHSPRLDGAEWHAHSEHTHSLTDAHTHTHRCAPSDAPPRPGPVSLTRVSRPRRAGPGQARGGR